MNEFKYLKFDNHWLKKYLADFKLPQDLYEPPSPLETIKSSIDLRLNLEAIISHKVKRASKRPVKKEIEMDLEPRKIISM